MVTGDLKFIRDNGKDQEVPADKKEDYRFVALNYANGDRYVGETFQGQKHGYGIYYWANGNYWYGQYRNNIRYGYGALFTPKGTIFYGKWIGDERKR